MEKKEKVESQKSKVAATPKQETNNQEHEVEQKQIRNQIKKVEEIISALEIKIKECDDKLSNADEYQKLMNDKTFFDNYNKLKTDLEKEMEKWEELNLKMS